MPVGEKEVSEARQRRGGLRGGEKATWETVVFCLSAQASNPTHPVSGACAGSDSGSDSGTGLPRWFGRNYLLPVIWCSVLVSK